jgi:hypothetical protein
MANTDKGEFIHRAFYKKAYLFVNQYMKSLSIIKAVLVSHFEGEPSGLDLPFNLGSLS